MAAGRRKWFITRATADTPRYRGETMAGRAGWILAGVAALVGGLIYHDRVGVSVGDEHDGSAVVIDARGDRSAEVDPATARALAAAAARLASAEARLASMKAIGKPTEAELAAVRTERDRAEAEVDRLEADIEERRARP